jgi:hypothetical protein
MNLSALPLSRSIREALRVKRLIFCTLHVENQRKTGMLDNRSRRNCPFVQF